MESVNCDLKQLTNDWNKLRNELSRNRKINFEVFNDVFLKTYQLLREQSAATSIDKEYVSLIVNAALFANVEIGETDFKCCAALVLTERMLNQVLTGAAASECAIYVFELRQEVYIDFANINEALEKLEKLYEASFWKK